MCIGSNSVNQAQDLMSVTKFEDFPNSLIPNEHCVCLRHCSSLGNRIVVYQVAVTFVASPTAPQHFAVACWTAGLLLTGRGGIALVSISNKSMFLLCSL